MKTIDICVLLLVLIILIVYFFLKRNDKTTLNNDKTILNNDIEEFSSLYNYSKMDLKEDHGIGMFGGNDEVFVYNIGFTPIAGPAGADQLNNAQNHSMPIIGFKPSEVKKINNFEKAIKTKNDIEYVDNNLMVPLLYHITKRLTIMIKSLQDQISECCY
jgi:hypothetical protein